MVRKKVQHEYVKKMGNNLVALLMLLMMVLMIFTYATAQTGLNSSMMKESIIAIEDSNVYIYIGSPDGAKVGRELDVYNIGAKPMVYKGLKASKENIWAR